ncbi:uncharacterized protein LOC119611595, partial [Lucilia sericata]|uniref:uncharacterized protein LOC119611595 n=1 Tax=Lucilia sericata TaxID=13632 RepID=UPI0018A7EFB4
IYTTTNLITQKDDMSSIETSQLTTYYVHLTSILIVYDSSNIIFNELQQQYLDDVQQVFENQSRYGNTIGLQWINVANFNDTDEDLNEQILAAVDLVAVEGFITILANTSRFLHARYYATRYTTLRLKDKIYLFLCEPGEENPKDFLANEILQFYPHHLMVIPETIYPESNNKKNNGQMQKPDIKLTTLTEENYYKYRGINFELWTQQYGGAEGNLKAIHLDTYISGNGTFAKNIQLYPNKLWNLQQRTLRIGSLTYVPYVKTYYVPSGQGDVDSIKSKGPQKTVQFIGVEAELMKSFCDIRNCHLRVEPYTADNWGIIYDNGSTEGMLGDLYKQNTEMAIGCIYNWYNDITETSRFIARSAVTILGPGPAQFPRWRTNIMPFSYGLWIFLVFTMVMCSIMFHFIKYTSYRFKHIYSARKNKYRSVKNYEKTLLDIFAVFIQQPSADTVLHRVASRIFLAFLLCATITLENTYSGQLKSILTMPLFNEPVDTMHKWSLTGWKWAAPSIIWVHTVENSDLAMEQRLAKQFEVKDYEFLYNATFWDNYGFGVERIYSGSFSFGDYITGAALENKIVPKDDLYFDWTRAVSIRGWPLMPLLDRHISFCLETGIYIHWERHFSYKFLDHQVQDILKKLASGSKPKSPPQMLSIEHISGPLFILLFGYLLAFIVLMVELFGHRLKMKFLAGGRYFIKYR